MKRFQSIIFLIIVLMIFSVSCMRVNKKTTTITLIDKSTGLPVVNLGVKYNGNLYKTDSNGQLTLVMYESNSKFIPEAPYILESLKENVAELDYDMLSEFTGVITLKSNSGYIYRIISTGKHLRTLIFETDLFESDFPVNSDSDKDSKDANIRDISKKGIVYSPLYNSENGKAYLGTSQNSDRQSEQTNTILFERITQNGKREISFAVLGVLPENIALPWYVIDLFSNNLIEKPIDNLHVIYEYNGRFVEKTIY